MYSYSFIIILFLLAGSVHLKESAKPLAIPAQQRLSEVPQEPSENFPCRKCDYIIKGYHNKGTQFVLPGQVICLDAAIRYENVVLQKIKGTKDKPIIIRN